jgi:hypothetical protein
VAAHGLSKASRWICCGGVGWRHILVCPGKEKATWKAILVWVPLEVNLIGKGQNRQRASSHQPEPEPPFVLLVASLNWERRDQAAVSGHELISTWADCDWSGDFVLGKRVLYGRDQWLMSKCNCKTSNIACATARFRSRDLSSWGRDSKRRAEVHMERHG